MEKLKPNEPGDTNNDFIEHDYLTDLRICEFRDVTLEEVKVTVKKAPSKSCESYPVPTTLLKDHLDTLLSSLTLIINESLEHGEFSIRIERNITTSTIKEVFT